ncbi:hypothetical protein PHYSODRAFT_260783 [Phytophthora sojae]|uniref:BZIP domain-containing protein n=1 Tax=Phytophthora sojae (strain P6497) TaxID=1094619 RepID=G4ZZN5_PHYSP|nr:hypothetical protein PHYSODRAFT_260783 [Phytophthora sojae]EGZ10381.1 hypothetical protein PHYSODRAFT_260783 [Phytophthora sojae]|eukprot:XP_009533126.1 hypothetical protein PHYSODRAFT_260783 [Phytophthora sojae]
MAKVYQLSRKRPHIVLPPNKKPTKSSRPPTPFTTFTALLDAAKSCDTSTEYPAKCDAAPAPVSSVTKRRLQNRESCRKTRLKRKLQQHAQDVLARERQARNEYLTQLADKLGVETRSKSQEDARDTLFRELATKSLHYALVDSEYSGWLDDSSDLCQWRFVGVSSVKVQRDGEIDAVAMTSTTRVRFHRLHVQDVSINVVRRERNTPFEFEVDGNNSK